MDNVSRTLNLNRIGPIDPTTHLCMDVIMSYFASPTNQKWTQNQELLQQCLGHINQTNP